MIRTTILAAIAFVVFYFGVVQNLDAMACAAMNSGTIETTSNASVYCN